MKTLQRTDQRPERPKDQELPSLPPLPPPQATCRQVWGGKCVAGVRGPEWSHDQHPSLAKRLARAQDPACPLRLLEALAASEDPEVREQLARHPRCPLSRLVRLAGDPEAWVRRAVAAHPRCPLWLLRQLAGDPDQQVRQAAADNPNSPPSIRGLGQV